MGKKCQECEDPIKGRADKKFCSDACRNAYNNRHNNYTNNLIKHVNFVLRKNRKILEELNPEGKTTVHLQKLIDKGFNFKYMTNIYETKAGKRYIFCYEYGYLRLDKDFYMLVHREES